MRRFRLLLWLYPKSFRNEYGGEIRRVLSSRRQNAHRPFGVVAFWIREIADTVRAAASAHWDILRQDVRHTSRAVRRTPGFFIAATLVTALGIGATTAAFTLTDHVLLRPLPFPEPNQLVKVWEGELDRGANLQGLQGTNDVAPANYRDWQAMSSSFATMGAYTPASSNLVGNGEPERLGGVLVTSETLDAIGIRPASGRQLLKEDDRPGAPCVMLISDAFWRRKFLASGSAIGSKVVLDDEPCHIVGIMPPGFDFPSRDASFWRPIRFDTAAFDDRTDTYLRVVARLKPGRSIGEARADLALVSGRLAKMYPDNKDVGAVVLSLRDEVGEQPRLMLIALAGASICVLLIACTNLASLVLVRGTNRARELAVRTALGAGRERLVRQLLTESAMIGLIGGTVGLLLAVLAIPVAAKLVPTLLPIAQVPGVDARMLLIAAIASLITVVGCGVLPALKSSRSGAGSALRDGARAGTSRRSERLRGALVVAQIMASVALLVGAGLLLRALWRVQSVDTGFKTQDVLTMRLNMPWPQYSPQATRVQFYNRAIDEVQAIPHVERAAFASFLPLTMRGGVWGVYLPGHSLAPADAAQGALVRFVTPGYFDVLGIPIQRGRTFDARDTLSGEQTAVVSASFGSKLWPNEPLLGKHFVLMRTDRTIVGVVGEIKVRGLERNSESQLYLPYQQQPDNNFVNYTPRDLAVRTDGSASTESAGAVAASIRQIVARIDPQLPVSDVQPLQQIVSRDTEARAVQARVLGGFAAMACVLSAIGLHGLLAFVVSARTREIGVRVALGARRRDILTMVLGRGVRLSLMGAAAGVGVAWLAGRSLGAILAGIDPADGVTLASAAVLAVAMACAGSLLPAIRAARTDPIVATKTE